MRRPPSTRRTAAIAVLLVVATAPSALARMQGPAPRLGTVAAVRSGLPAGAPAALYLPEPTLPAPRSWPFPEGFPRTSGFGRVTGGASYWSDFLYDDHGAKGVVVSGPVIGLSPPEGTYTYPAGPAAENGADIFRAAVGLDDTSTWWRVDWLSLADAKLPAAMWAIDSDDNAATGSAAWPAGAGVSTPGTERWLFVSSRGAWVIDKAGSQVRLPSGVDMRSKSFLVRVPRSLLPTSGRTRIRLASGLANPTGDGFAAVGTGSGALPGQPALYNVAFRSDPQEPVAAENWWREDSQAAALATGDITPFNRAITWSDLARRRTEPEPRPTGYTNRWYASSSSFGHGIARNPPQWSSDLRANYLDRVQPYGLFVPAGTRTDTPVPLTVLLHSLNTQHNQYATWNPTFLDALCQRRHSICLVPFARGPDSWFFDEGEQDVWETWNRVASDYALDPARSIISGYSMGGYGVYRFGLEHPDLFAQAVAMAGPPNCALRLVSPAEVPANPGLAGCEHEADTSPLVPNARHLPFFIGQGAVDELVWSPSAVQQAQRFDDLGYRYRLELYARQGHVAWAETGHFDGAIAWLADRTRAPTPARIDYTFYPSHQRRDLGTGPDGAWWVTGVKARLHGVGALGTVSAFSHALPDAQPAQLRTQDALNNTDGPAAVRQLAWGQVHRASTAPAPVLDLILRNVTAAGIRMADAGLADRRATLHVTTDGSSRLGLLGLTPGSVVHVAGVATTTAGPSGTAWVTVAAGSSVIVVEPPMLRRGAAAT